MDVNSEPSDEFGLQGKKLTEQKRSSVKGRQMRKKMLQHAQ